jgi:MFS family permease
MKIDIKGFFSKSIIPIAIIYFALFFDFFLQEGFVIVRKDLEKLYGWNSDYLTSTLAIGKFVMMACCPIIAYASSRVAAHHIFVFGLICLACCTTAFSFSSSYALFAVARVFHGISSPSMMLSGMAILTHLSEKTSRGKYASYGYSGIAHGLLLAPLCLGRLVSGLGQRYAFVLITGLIIINTVAAIVHFYDIPIFRRSLNKTDNEDVISTQSFHPITGDNVLGLLKVILSNPRMLTAVSSCFLVGISIGANESVLPGILDEMAEDLRMDDTYVELIWTGGSITYTIFALVSGYASDRVSPLKLVIGGMVAFIITYSLMAVSCSNLGGLTAFVAITGGLTSFLDVAAYPLIASVVDTADIPNAYIIGYSIEYCLEQGGYAIGQYTGQPLYLAASESLAPVAAMVAGVDGALLAFGLFVCFVYPADRFVVKSKNEEEEEIKKSASVGTSPTIAEEL